MLDAVFPVYALRANFGRHQEPPFTIISTKFRQYILDMPDLKGNYMERRLKLMEMELDFPLYPLKERYENIAQILRKSRRKEFIDSNGKIWRISKCKTYAISSYRVLHSSRTWNGKWLMQTKAGNFVNSQLGKYVTVIETPKGKILYDIEDEPTSRTRIKL